MCLLGPRCLHGYFGGLHGRYLGGFWCASLPSFQSQHPSNNKISLGQHGNRATSTRSAYSSFWHSKTIVLLVIPVAVKLSVWIGLFGLGHPIEMRVCLWGIISLVVTKRAATSDLAADAITNLMIWAIERAAPLKRCNSLFSERKIGALAWLWEIFSLRNPASE